MITKQLSEEHWKYIESLLVHHGVPAEIVQASGFHYRTAFIHGFKHGVEYITEKETENGK